MFAKSVLITGCNRGLGLELVKHLAGKAEHIFATCRTPDKADELQKVAKEHKHVIILKLDVTQEEEIAKMVGDITGVVGENGLNCIINNAGILQRDTRESVTAESLKLHYAVNTVAPAMIIKACLPLLRQASLLSDPSKSMSVSRASILNISTKVASIADNSSGNNYGYRMSKAALNMLTMNLSIELKKDRILAVSIHPGWVMTDMGGPNAMISATKSIEGMLSVAENLSEKDTGMFYGWNDEKIPW